VAAGIRDRARSAAGIVAVVLATSACASTGALSVDPLRGQETEQVQRDRAECEAAAKHERGRSVFFKTKAAAVLAGTVFGAGVGLVALAGTDTSTGSRETASLILGAAALGAAAGFVVGEVGGTFLGWKEHRRQGCLPRPLRALPRRARLPGHAVSPPTPSPAVASWVLAQWTRARASASRTCQAS
jgi:hypothetical protein